MKSVTNPDKRVVIIRDFAKANFLATPILDYALEVEKITTQKKSNLILNVDGVIACAFVDMVRSCGVFSPDEAEEAVTVRAGRACVDFGMSCDDVCLSCVHRMAA